ncbi:hypothetical protein [uncultured Desulfosarcina sp.]|uniref:hypothetical protein n=1 Tax=uncultured Desulfosarcina sp. TaxID=218289 RepID=UPI0029C6D085|nr:hypothetical protein [uncultured Desulfosarcina sp.]
MLFKSIQIGEKEGALSKLKDFYILYERPLLFLIISIALILKFGSDYYYAKHGENVLDPYEKVISYFLREKPVIELSHVNRQRETLPKPAIVIFEKTFNLAGADKYGRIKIFKWGSLRERVGDRIVFKGTGPYKIWRGAQGWRDESGVIRDRIERVPRGKWLGVWVGPDTKLTVQIFRRRSG